MSSAFPHGSPPRQPLLNSSRLGSRWKSVQLLVLAVALFGAFALFALSFFITFVSSNHWLLTVAGLLLTGVLFATALGARRPVKDGAPRE